MGCFRKSPARRSDAYPWINLMKPMWKPKTRCAPGGFATGKKKCLLPMRVVREAATRALASRVARGRDVHP